MNLKILLSGDGGQGVQLLSHLICTAVFNKGLSVSHIPNYGLEQKGGVSVAYIKISSEDVTYPKFSKPDLLLIMSDQSRERTVSYNQEGVVVIDVKDYVEMLKENNVQPKSRNIFFLGMIVKNLTDNKILETEEVLTLLEAKLVQKPGWEENKQAFDLGLKQSLTLI